MQTRLTLFSFDTLWLVCSIREFFISNRESQLRIHIHGFTHTLASRCAAFITCVHRRRRTETETYFWALHLSASQRSRRALASSIIRMRPRVSLLLSPSLSSLGCRCCCCWCYCCYRLRVPSHRQRATRARSRLPNCCWIRRILSRALMTDSLKSVALFEHLAWKLF